MTWTMLVAIPGHDGQYAGDDGHVWSFGRGGDILRRREVKARGGETPRINMPGGARPRLASIIADAFLGPAPEGHIAMPPYDAVSDCRPTSLSWRPLTIGKRGRLMETITVDGVTKTAQEWSKITGINRKTIAARVSRGWKAAEAIAAKALPSTSAQRNAWTRGNDSSRCACQSCRDGSARSVARPKEEQRKRLLNEFRARAKVGLEDVTTEPEFQL